MKFTYPLYVLGREDDYVTIQGNALLVFTEDWIAHAHRAGNSVSAVVVTIQSSDELKHFLRELPPSVTNLALNAPIDDERLVQLGGIAELRQFSELAHEPPPGSDTGSTSIFQSGDDQYESFLKAQEAQQEPGSVLERPRPFTKPPKGSQLAMIVIFCGALAIFIFLRLSLWLNW